MEHCKVCGISLVGGKPSSKYMPCGIAPRAFVSMANSRRPTKVVRVHHGCPFEPKQEPHLLSIIEVWNEYNSAEPHEQAPVEEYYDDPQDFRPSGDGQNHTAIEFARRDNRSGIQGK